MFHLVSLDVYKALKLLRPIQYPILNTKLQMEESDLTMDRLLIHKTWLILLEIVTRVYLVI